MSERVVLSFTKNENGHYVLDNPEATQGIDLGNYDFLDFDPLGVGNIDTSGQTHTPSDLEQKFNDWETNDSISKTDRGQV